MTRSLMLIVLLIAVATFMAFPAGANTVGLPSLELCARNAVRAYVGYMSSEDELDMDMWRRAIEVYTEHILQLSPSIQLLGEISKAFDGRRYAAIALYCRALIEERDVVKVKECLREAEELFPQIKEESLMIMGKRYILGDLPRGIDAIGKWLVTFQICIDKQLFGLPDQADVTFTVASDSLDHSLPRKQQCLTRSAGDLREAIELATEENLEQSSVAFLVPGNTPFEAIINNGTPFLVDPPQDEYEYILYVIGKSTFVLVANVQYSL